MARRTRCVRGDAFAGGILVRYYLQHNGLPPGNTASSCSHPQSGQRLPITCVIGPLPLVDGAGWPTVGNRPDGIVHRLRPIPWMGIIAAGRSLQPWFSRLLPGEDDGAVSVAQHPSAGDA